MTDNAAEQVVDAFVTAIGNKDEAATMALVSDDVFYDNVPVGSMTGKGPMAEFLAPMFKSKGPVEFEILRQTAAGNIVMNERIDKFQAKGREIAMPVAGVFEVNDGLITFWRDYFDNGMFMKALKGE
ncbi:MAG: limonene-1,2-epoxide hydrolase [Candidatus Poriferisodalaceae bacterium]|jgi:limonene-1,2-epoxide hydrolase